MERNEEVHVNAAPWKVYEVTVLPDEKGKTRKLHARVVNNVDSSDIFEAPYNNLDGTMQDATVRCALCNGEQE